MGPFARVRRRWRSWAINRDVGLAGNDLSVLHQELRRARRFEMQLAIVVLRFADSPDTPDLDLVGQRLTATLREFDCVLVDKTHCEASLWLAGADRHGAEAKLARLRSDPAFGPLIALGTVGLAAFPDDGMTVEALQAAARADAARPASTQAHDDEAGARWQRSNPSFGQLRTSWVPGGEPRRD